MQFNVGYIKLVLQTKLGTFCLIGLCHCSVASILYKRGLKN